MRILVVDDEPDIRLSTQLLLEHFGYTVNVASDGAQALEVAARCPPDAVLLDLQMPVMDGFTAARKLREQPATACAFIVVISAYVRDRAWCDRAMAAGVDECLGKPLDYERLQRLLEGPRPRAHH